MKARKATACSTIAAAIVGRRPARSETAPIASRPRTAPAPVALMVPAAASGEWPRSRAKGTRCTSGTKTGIHVAEKAKPSSQNARVRMAAPSARPPAVTAAVSAGAGRPSGCRLIDSGSRRITWAVATRTTNTSAPPTR